MKIRFCGVCSEAIDIDKVLDHEVIINRKRERNTEKYHLQCPNIKCRKWIWQTESNKEK